MHRKKKGTLKSGSGRTVTSPKQAIAIALSEARKKGAEVAAEIDAQERNQNVRFTQAQQQLTDARPPPRPHPIRSHRPRPHRPGCVASGLRPRRAQFPSAAVVSADRAKLKVLSKKYRIDRTYSYDEYDSCLDQVDAVYIALPNSMHAEYTVRAAEAGVHVLCEKPMAVTVDECQRMIDACHANGVKLMIAYRLLFARMLFSRTIMANDEL